MRLKIRKHKRVITAAVSLMIMLAVLWNCYPYMGNVLFYPAHREIARDNFINECRDYNVLSGDGVNVYYTGDRYSSAVLIAGRVKDSLGMLSGDLGYKPYDRINVIIYPEYEKMAYMMSLGPGSPALGAYYCGTIGVYDPDGSSVFKPERQTLIIHELTHYFLDYMSNGNMPSWFTEGMALYEEYRAYGTEWAKTMNYSSYYSIDELENGFYNLDEIKAYKESFLIVRYVCDKYGNTAITDIVNNLKTGKSMEQALHEALGMDAADIIEKSLK